MKSKSAKSDAVAALSCKLPPSLHARRFGWSLDYYISIYPSSSRFTWSPYYVYWATSTTGTHGLNLLTLIQICSHSLWHLLWHLPLISIGYHPIPVHLNVSMARSCFLGYKFQHYKASYHITSKVSTVAKLQVILSLSTSSCHNSVMTNPIKLFQDLQICLQSFQWVSTLLITLCSALLPLNLSLSVLWSCLPSHVGLPFNTVSNSKLMLPINMKMPHALLMNFVSMTECGFAALLTTLVNRPFYSWSVLYSWPCLSSNQWCCHHWPRQYSWMYQDLLPWGCKCWVNF